MRPLQLEFVEANVAYVLGKGVIGVVLSRSSTDYSTVLYFMSRVIKKVKRETGKSVVFLADNLSAHLKTQRVAIEHTLNKHNLTALIRFNLAGYSMLNAVENFFSSVKQSYYSSCIGIDDLHELSNIFWIN